MVQIVTLEDLLVFAAISLYFFASQDAAYPLLCLAADGEFFLAEVSLDYNKSIEKAFCDFTLYTYGLIGLERALDIICIP